MVIHGFVHMKKPLILASSSDIRAKLLQNAGLSFETSAARIDEDAVKAAFLSDDSPARDLADTLAEMKALKIGRKRPDALVLGCDQVLSHSGAILSKPDTPDAAKDQLSRLSGQKHQLLSAIVAVEEARSIWRHVGVVTLHMRSLSENYIDAYVTRNWDSIRHSVGSYKLEEEGVRLFTAISGDYFTVLGMPLLPLLNWLAVRGDIET